MCANLNTLRSKVFLQKSKDLICKSMMGHLYTRGLRQHFMKFRRQVLKEIVVEDVNVQGPVVEEVLN